MDVMNIGRCGIMMLVAGAACPVFAVSFDVLGSDYQFYATAISYDGTAVVGDGLVPPLGTSRWGMRWTRSGGLEFMGTADPAYQYGIPAAISGSGSVVAGYYQDSANTRTAFRWTQAQGYQSLTGGASPAAWRNVTGISGDGSAIVGQADFGSGPRAFRWTAATGTQNLADSGGSAIISADGSTMAGSGIGQAFTWTHSGGVRPIPALGGYANMWPQAISADGSVVVGTAQGSSAGVVFRYTSGGIEDMGRPSEQFVGVSVAGASADANTIVGNSIDP